MIGFHLVLPHMKELSGSFPNHAIFKLPCRTTPPPPPPQLPIPKILFHPLAILFHPLANLCKVCMTGTDRSPPPLDLECGWRHTGNVQEGGCFSIFRRADDVTRTMSKGGGCAWCSTHPSSDPPHTPGWLATGLDMSELVQQILSQAPLGNRALELCESNLKVNNHGTCVLSASLMCPLSSIIIIGPHHPRKSGYQIWLQYLKTWSQLR